MKRGQVRPPLFDRIAIIGFGLIGSSLARKVRKEKLARRIVACDAGAAARATIKKLRLADRVVSGAGDAVAGADLVVLAVPQSANATVAKAIARHLAPGAIVTDVGSVKEAALRDLRAYLGSDAILVPGHPIAGTENSGPQSGFAELFAGRWCVLTPPPGTPAGAVAKVRELWRRCGMRVETMDAAHHDRVLAITSHVPHLIAYTIVDTVAELEGHLKAEVIKFAASGFRDFTRVAASDPVMWRDIFLANKEAVLEMMARLYEDIALLQKAIRNGDGKTLHRVFTRSRRIRRSIVQAKQD
ncbi:MAG: prephenate/arogenate dehydrogenase family protein [Alphaproteobacteria bacterium]|nr:prephenate/arogenate dehydrogenase family protein [Alphaproteobacteria bacterium]